MTTKQIAEIAAIVVREMRKEEQATTDQMQGVGEKVDTIEAVAKTGVEKKAKPRKAKAKTPKPQPHVVGSGRVELTDNLWRTWVAAKALLKAEAELATEGSPDNGFTTVSASAKFMAQFMGREFWLTSVIHSVGNSMIQLKKKGLLDWEEEPLASSKGRSVRLNLRLGPLA
jgi:hypothetical protein